jgi:hypothetical protein
LLLQDIKESPNKNAKPYGSVAEAMLYRSTYISDGNIIKDIFDGGNYKQLVEDGMFSSEYDVALGITSDGFRLFKSKPYDCWPLLVVNYNLPPKLRRKFQYSHIAALIPGPKAPKNFNSFLWPVINDLLELQEGIQNVKTPTSCTHKKSSIQKSG